MWKLSKARSGEELLEFVNRDGKIMAIITGEHIDFPDEFVLRIRHSPLADDTPKRLGVSTAEPIEKALGVALGLITEEIENLRDLLKPTITE